MKLGWLSDIHLDHADDGVRESFLDRLAATPADAWLLGGDIGTASSVVPFLELLASRLSQPIYFVLGNHDFYGGSLSSVRDDVRTLTRRSRHLVWLTESDPVRLTPSLTLVGDDSWADARFGDPLGSRVELNDFYLIRDLKGLDNAERVRALNRVGDEAASRIAPRLRTAMESSRRVIVLTHVPPFREATWHEGAVSSDAWLPWFSCKAVGDVILECARTIPTCEVLVLCGHTHSPGHCRPAHNVEVLTASAVYAAPRLQRVLNMDTTFRHRLSSE